MSIRSKADKIRGKIKEAVGVLTSSEILKKQGQLDQEAGEMKDDAAAEAALVKEKQEEVAAEKAEKVDARVKAKRDAVRGPKP